MCLIPLLQEAQVVPVSARAVDLEHVPPVLFPALEDWLVFAVSASVAPEAVATLASPVLAIEVPCAPPVPPLSIDLWPVSRWPPRLAISASDSKPVLWVAEREAHRLVKFLLVLRLDALSDRYFSKSALLIFFRPLNRES